MMKKQKIWFLLLAILLFLQGCHFPSTNDQQEQTGVNTNYYTDVTHTYTSKVDEAILATSRDALYLLLANKEYSLTSAYEPSALTELPNEIVAEWHRAAGLYLEERTAAALLFMLAEMKAAGVTDIQVTSAYRSYERQRQLFQQYVNEEQRGISEEAYEYFGTEYIKTNYLDRGIQRLTKDDAEKVVLSYSAYPGTSEHQTGLCVDFITSTMNGKLNEKFATTEAFAWLKDNAYRFGFILRYPDGKESITGYSYEPWHYRFVGREAATDIHFGNLTLEQYLSGQGIQA